LGISARGSLLAVFIPPRLISRRHRRQWGTSTWRHPLIIELFPFSFLVNINYVRNDHHYSLKAASTKLGKQGEREKPTRVDGIFKTPSTPLPLNTQRISKKESILFYLMG
jgi:hypothetical protein